VLWTPVQTIILLLLNSWSRRYKRRMVKETATEERR